MKSQSIPNAKLRQLREKRNWTQTELARKLGTTYLSVCRWENGTTSPSPYYRKQLCELFEMSLEELGLNSAQEECIWSLPYRRNPFFIGREDLLARLHEHLNSCQVAALSQPQVLSGLGGIGKTQTAIEYAFRHRSDYQAVFWICAENREVWYADLITLARRLNLLEQKETDAGSALTALTRWLEIHTHWLLILDNIEDFMLLDELVPAVPQGHILVTTRAQFTGVVAQRLDLDHLSPVQGAIFLLRRAKLLGLDTPLENIPEDRMRRAKEICLLLGGLPLALDQAGAYIEETGCSLVDYLEVYQHGHRELLSRRGLHGRDHPESVSSTVLLCLEQIARIYPAAIDLLRICAFLAPDAIPEEIFTKGAPDLCPLLSLLATNGLAFNTLFATLRTYSLIHRDSENKTLTIHRLTQVILKDLLDEAQQRVWAEYCVRAVRRTFPEFPHTFWEGSVRLLPQAHICVTLVNQWHMAFLEAGQLLDLTGYYVMQLGQYQQAESLLLQGCSLVEENVGSKHLDFALCLGHLGELYWHMHRLDQSLLYWQQALEIWESTLGPDHATVALALNGLALTYRTQGQSELAESVFLRAYAIYERLQLQAPLSRNEREALTGCAQDLGILYIEQGKFAKAEPLLDLTLTLSKQLWGKNHFATAFAYHNLGYLYEWRGEFQQAEKFYRQALVIREKAANVAGPSIAATLHNLARVYQKQAQYARAEMLFQQALSIRERVFGSQHPAVAHTLSQMGSLYLEQKEDMRALPLLTEALMIREKALGSDHPTVAWDLEALAQAYEAQGCYSDAEQLVQRALAIYETKLGRDHLDSVESLLIAGNLAQKQQQNREAEQFFEHALSICERLLGDEHPKTATCLYQLAELYARQNRIDDARKFFLQSLTIREHCIGPTHPETVAVRESYRRMSCAQSNGFSNK